MSPKNDPNTTDEPKTADPATSLENAQKSEDGTQEIEEAAESLDQNTPNQDSNSDQEDSAKKNIFNTIETVGTDEPVKKSNKIISYIKHLDSYVLIFLLIIIVIVCMIFYLIIKNKNPNITAANSQTLSQSSLSQLNSNNVALGGSQETLNIQSNSIFSGSALIKGDLQVAGTATVAGNTTLQNVTISGNSQLNQIAGSTLAITGNTTLKGQLVVGQSLTVSGNTTLSGAVNAGKLTVSSLQVNGNIEIDYHLVTNGNSPTIKSFGSSIIGSGGTVSINGTDTAGSIAINFGTSTASGCDVSITFNQAFATIPSIIISPTSSVAANLGYYVTDKSDSGFEVCTTSSPNTPGTANFDYFVIN
jgi:cytoskeletal protein CcmA (bactofilin family)